MGTEPVDKAAQMPVRNPQASATCEHDWCRVQRGDWSESIARIATFGNIAPCPIHGIPGERRPPEAAPLIVMDQRGNYWRVFPKGTLAGADQDMWSMCPVSAENYASEPVAIYRQGRDLSAQQAADLLSRIFCDTDDDLLKRAAKSAWQAWTTGRDMVTESELLLQGIAIRLGVADSEGAGGGSDGPTD